MSTTASPVYEDRDLLQLLVRFRRDLHRIPELGFELPQTIAYVESVLNDLACEVVHPCLSCVCAYFSCGIEGAPTIAVRADMDALPISEATGCSFASEHPGRMHACGHDAHMAMALAAATEVDRTLRERPGALARNVLFVFQPAEETTGGAKTVCESGVFERYGADRIFGFHVWPDLPFGTIGSCPGPLLARSSETHIHIHGQSLHIGKTLGVPASESRDAALAAAHFLVAESELMERLGVEEPCIAKFGLVEAGTVCNAVAGEAHLAGSVRVFSDVMFARVQKGLRDALDAACAAVGCTYEIDFAEGYPPVDNDPELFEAAASALSKLKRLPEPLLIAEDFAFYQRHLPGVFFLLGTGAPADAVPGDAPVDNPRDEQGCPLFATTALHTDTMLFSEEALLAGLDAYRRLIRLP